jgi:Tfp pilus assembly protein PilF
MQAYQAARAAVRRGDYAEARQQLLAAVAAKPDFTEAWYNLGASYGMLAIEAAAVGEDSRAIEYFREAVEAKRRAEALIGEGKWFLYGPKEQAQTIADLKEGLKDADEVLADERSLLMALRLHALASR